MIFGFDIYILKQCLGSKGISEKGYKVVTRGHRMRRGRLDKSDRQKSAELPGK